jgi:hypothetical protein
MVAINKGKKRKSSRAKARAKPAKVTTLAVGEEDPPVTTLAYGEEHPPVTTLMFGEETVWTTLAIGEEDPVASPVGGKGGKSQATTSRRGKETPPPTTPWKPTEEIPPSHWINRFVELYYQPAAGLKIR